jgi:predicted aspartyl protease
MWVALSGKDVVATGDSPLSVIAEAQKNGHMQTFIQRVGYEDQTEFRVRRIAFPYDTTYNNGFVPLPRAKVILKNVHGTAQKPLDDIILDTGADMTCIPGTDCDAAQLAAGRKHYFKTRMYDQVPQRSVFYQANIEVDGKDRLSLVERVPDGEERILGRDVLNQIKATFDGPLGTVTLE